MNFFGIICLLITFYSGRIFAAQTKEAQTNDFKKKNILVLDLNIQHFSWEDLLLKRESDFVEPILESWVKWFKDHPSKHLSTPEICSSPCTAYRDWTSRAVFDSRLEDHVSLWFKVNLSVRKLGSELPQKSNLYEWSGSLIVMDAKTKKKLSHFDFKLDKKYLVGKTQKEINSALASFLYRTPLGGFENLVHNPDKIKSDFKMRRLMVRHYKNVLDLFSLIDLLRIEGKALNLSVELASLDGQGGDLLCYFSGEEKSFIDLLSRLKELKSSQVYRIVNDFTGIHHVLKLIAE